MMNLPIIVRYLIVFFVSMVPIVELRGAIPIAESLKLNIFLYYPIAIIGNMLPVPVIYLFARKVLEWGKDKKLIGGFFTWCLKKGEHGGKKLREKAGEQGIFLALLLFVGIPIPGVTVKIVDDDFQELPYGKRGQIVVDTPCGMLEYYHKPEATDKYFRYDEQGVRWSCTGDIGSMGDKGDLFVDAKNIGAQKDQK